MAVTVLTAGDPAQHPVTSGARAWELFTDAPDVIAARVGGELRDLSTELTDGDEVTILPAVAGGR